MPFLVKSSTKNEAGSSIGKEEGKEEVTGIIIVDHGSRKPEANDMLIEVLLSFSLLFVHFYESIEAHMVCLYE